MKIKDTPKAGSIHQSRSVQQSAGRRIQDRVEVDHEELRDAIRTAESQAGLERQQELKHIEKAVAEGTYRPDPHRLAEEVLRSALLLARLRSLLK